MAASDALQTLVPPGGIQCGSGRHPDILYMCICINQTFVLFLLCIWMCEYVHVCVGYHWSQKKMEGLPGAELTGSREC